MHRSWPKAGAKASDLFIAAGSLVGGGHYSANNDIDASSPDNQQASIGIRSAFPGRGLELFGELLRNDAAHDVFELLTEPDHDVALAWGFQRVLVRGATWHVLRAEFVNGGWNQSSRVRPEVTAYQHSILVQGHTNRGELLAAPLLERTGGTLLGWDVYDAAGRRTLEFATLADRLKDAIEWVEDVSVSGSAGLTGLPGWWEIVVPALEEWDRLRGGEF